MPDTWHRNHTTVGHSYTANTVFPRQGGQTPHIDYPYWTVDEKFGLSLIQQPLAIVYIALITDFTVDNGATSLRPNSHKDPKYPTNQTEFFENAMQVEGRAGDILVIRSSVQHCAMPNLSAQTRSGVIIHMGPTFIRPYENIPAGLHQSIKDRASPEMRKVTGLDNPFPRLKK